MTRLQMAAVILDLAEALRNAGSWCGETHLQKAVYLLQETGRVPLGFDFFLYKHGPFSFDFRDELTALWADGLMESRVNPGGYGPSFHVTTPGRELQRHFPKTLKKHHRAIHFIAAQLGSKGVVELERVATGVYVTLNYNSTSAEKRALQLHRLKPHIPMDEARKAVCAAEKLVKLATSL